MHSALEDQDPALLFATLEDAIFAAAEDLRARRNADAAYPGKRFVLAFVANYAGCGAAWIEAKEAHELSFHVLAYGITDETGEQMLGNDGEWYVVA